MRSRVLISVFAVSIYATGCAPKQQGAPPVAPPAASSVPEPLKPGALPEITSRTEEGFQDIVLGIQTTQSVAGALVIDAAGTHKGRRVALRIRIKDGMKPLVLDGKPSAEGFSPDGIHILSTGAESDRLLSILAGLYGVKIGKAKMRPDTTFGCAALEGDPARMKTELVKFKLFHGEEESECELFLNVDLAGGAVELREKDPDYRKAAIAALNS